MLNDFKAIFKYELRQVLTKRNIIIMLIFLILMLIFLQLKINQYKRQLELQKSYHDTMERKPV